MAIWETVTRDLKVDSDYGDFEIQNNDIATTTDPRLVLKYGVIERFKTNINDFILSPAYGANVERFLGRAVDLDLANNVVASLRYSLTYDNFVDARTLSIIPILLGNKLQLYTYITFNNTSVEIRSTFEDGVLQID